jgi:ATP-dependent RNA helicase DDX24/MAK5
MRSEQGLAYFPVDLTLMPQLKERTQLAVEIEKAMHRQDKKQHESNWFRQTAEAMDIILDVDLVSANESEDDVPKDRPRKRQKTVTSVIPLKHSLEDLLRQPLMPRGVSARYPTSGVVESLPQKILKNRSDVDGLTQLPTLVRARAIDIAAGK